MAPKAAAAAKPAVKRPAEGADNPPAKKGGVGLGQGRKKSNGLGKATGGTSQDGRARGCERAGRCACAAGRCELRARGCVRTRAEVAGCGTCWAAGLGAPPRGGPNMFLCRRGVLSGPPLLLSRFSY